MIPGLGGKYKSVVEIETISKPRQGFRDIEYMKLGLPMARRSWWEMKSSFKDVRPPRKRLRPPFVDS